MQKAAKFATKCLWKCAYICSYDSVRQGSDKCMITNVRAYFALFTAAHPNTQCSSPKPDENATPEQQLEKMEAVCLQSKLHCGVMQLLCICVPTHVFFHTAVGGVLSGREWIWSSVCFGSTPFFDGC